ncbi:serine/threonine protein kinase [Nonomuraea sp. NPDC047897]|uniref:serine/threonine protein kinase n=1 Tax=Nonomuraea sp. NPDC047897 TaxID=3364346 RepID=UPI0037205E85
MPSSMPLLPGDPRELGGLKLLGRLGEGGQGVVYLATTPMGAHVVVKWLRGDRSDEESVERFLREAQLAQRVAPFCTAAVLSTGVEANRPYIMSEFVEGPTLHRVVEDEGPRSGAALDRLAIGTATALAAIQEAKVVHRDFKPSNVIIAADGPRVIDFGIARPLGPVPMTSSTQIGTPSYMSPEQIMGHAVGPATDMFSWAGTMVFASCGHAPFGGDTTHAVMSRVLRDPPDLGLLDGPLREVVRQCLAKDPAQRPTAEEVIMRLLRHPVPSSDLLKEGTRQAAPSGVPRVDRPGSRRKRVVIGASITVLLVVAGVAVAEGLRRVPPGGDPTRSAVATAEGTTSPPRAPAVPVRTGLPGGSAVLYEHPSDPIILTAYEIYSKSADEHVDYARQSLRGPFEKHAGNLESLVSPDGRYLAGRHEDYTADGYDSILVTDREAGASFRVKTVRKPLESLLRAWSKDGSKILLDVNRRTETKGGEDEWTALGFAVIDVDRRDVARSKARVIDVDDSSIRDGEFGWDGDEEGVVSVYGADEGLRFFDAAGRATRDVPDVGPVPADVVDIFSPSGRTFVTDCPRGHRGDHCLWDTRTGRQVRRFSSDCDTVLGWYDETHLYCWERDNGSRIELQVVGFDGKLVRKLLEVPPKLGLIPYFTINPSRTS